MRYRDAEDESAAYTDRGEDRGTVPLGRRTVLLLIGGAAAGLGINQYRGSVDGDRYPTQTTETVDDTVTFGYGGSPVTTANRTPTSRTPTAWTTDIVTSLVGTESPTATASSTRTRSPTPTSTDAGTGSGGGGGAGSPTPTASATRTPSPTDAASPTSVEREYGEQGYGEYGYGGVLS